MSITTRYGEVFVVIEQEPSDDPQSGRGRFRRVLLWMPGNRVLGGHVVQMERTATALGDAGLEVRTDFSDDPDPTSVDLVHGFGLSAGDVRLWHRRGIPVVISTIYWPRAYRMGPGRPSALSWPAAARGKARAVAVRGKQATRFAWAGVRGMAALTGDCLRFTADERALFGAFESADLLLPNARGEADSIGRDLGVSTPMITIPNGVDPVSFAEPYPSFEERGYVLFVGRIEPHKNQLGLIRALSGAGLPLVIAGYEHPDHLGYDRECRDAGAGWVTFTGPVSPDALPDLFAGPGCMFLPTWFETTGLVSLEAALSGCSVVTTSRGYAREYFEDLAWYCDPQEPGSILHAVRRAWETRPSPDLRKKVLARYTWKQVADATVAAYGSLGDPPRGERATG